MFVYGCSLALDDPKRFRVEVLFSPGAAVNPFDPREEGKHVLPVAPRVPITIGGMQPYH